MRYCVEHPEEVSKLAKVKAQVSQVKGVMMENIDKVLHWLLHILILTPLWLSNKIALTLHIEERFVIYMSLAYRVMCLCMFRCFITIKLSLEFHLISFGKSQYYYTCYVQVIDRGEKIEVLVDKTENLRSQVRCLILFFVFSRKWAKPTVLYM